MRRVAMLALLAVAYMGMNAQEVVSQEAAEKTKAINQVKLSEQAMYAEVVQLASDDFEAVSLAQQKTINKLQNSVIEACARQMNITKEQAKEIFDTIDDKCQNVVVKKGDMVRVFAYIAKDAVGLGRKKAKQKDIDEIFGPDEPEADADSAMVADQTMQAMNLLMGKKDSIDNVSFLKPVAITTTTTTTTVVTTTEVAKPIEEPIVVTAPEPKPVAEPVAKVELKSVPVVEVSVPELCQTMIDKGNMKELMRFLNQEKRYQKLMFGNSSSMQCPEKCYVVILDKATQSIVSVLDKGETERMNFMTKKMDRYANYRNGNYAAVFVQEY